jgi:hypothetical protein
MRLFLYLLTLLILPRLCAQADTAAILAGIKQRIALTDNAQIGAVFIRMPDQDQAQRIDPESPGPEEKTERYEFYCDEEGAILGIGTFVTPTIPGAEESYTHYFDAEGKTIAVWGLLKWTASKCTPGLAREEHFIYVHPADSLFKETVRVMDEKGAELKASACKYPDVERLFEAFYDRDVFMRKKRIKLE